MKEAHGGICGVQNPSYIIASKEWVIIALSWSIIVSTMQKGVTHVSSMSSLFNNLKNHFIQL